MRAADGVIRLLRGEIAGFRFSYGVLFLLSVERKCGISFLGGLGCFPCFPDFCISLYIFRIFVYLCISYGRKGVVDISYLWRDTVLLWRGALYDPDLFTVTYERVILEAVTAVEYCAVDEEGQSCGKLVVYLREGLSTVNGEPYTGSAFCMPGDRLIPWTGGNGGEMPSDGGFRIRSVEHRVHGSPLLRHTKLTAN